MLALAFPSGYPVPETPAPSPLPLKTYRLQPR
jgi:hypothetical protein